MSPSSTGFHMQTGIKANANLKSIDTYGNLNWTGTTGIVIPDVTLILLLIGKM